MGSAETTYGTSLIFLRVLKDMPYSVDVFKMHVFQMTCDGEVIVCHDDNLSRVCGVNEQISDHTLHSLPHCLSEMEVSIN